MAILLFHHSLSRYARYYAYLKSARLHPAKQLVQAGFSLPVALVVLLVLTILGGSFVTSTVYNEQIAGNQNQYLIALEDAQAALWVGETFIGKCTGRPHSQDEIDINDNADGLCTIQDFVWEDNLSDYELSNTALPWYRQPYAWWAAKIPRTAPLLNASNDFRARYTIEELYFEADSLSNTGGYSSPPGTVYYRITARGNAQNDNSAITVQSGYSRHFN